MRCEDEAPAARVIMVTQPICETFAFIVVRRIIKSRFQRDGQLINFCLPNEVYVEPKEPVMVATLVGCSAAIGIVGDDAAEMRIPVDTPMFEAELGKIKKVPECRLKSQLSTFRVVEKMCAWFEYEVARESKVTFAATFEYRVLSLGVQVADYA